MSAERVWSWSWTGIKNRQCWLTSRGLLYVVSVLSVCCSPLLHLADMCHLWLIWLLVSFTLVQTELMVLVQCTVASAVRTTHLLKSYAVLYSWFKLAVIQLVKLWLHSTGSEVSAVHWAANQRENPPCSNLFLLSWCCYDADVDMLAEYTRHTFTSVALLIQPLQSLEMQLNRTNVNKIKRAVWN